MKRAMEMEGGDGGTVTCLMPLSCTLRNDYGVKLDVHFTAVKKMPTNQNCSGHSGAGQVEAGAFALWFPHPHPETCALIPFVLSWVVMAPSAEPGCLILCVSEFSLWLDIVHSKRGRYVNINFGSGT